LIRGHLYRLHQTKMDENAKPALLTAASEHIADVVYSVAFDVCNEIIDAGGDQEATLECANRVVARYVGEGIKVRKKPAPRAKTSAVKDKQVDTLTAASRKLNKQKYLWMYHPKTERFSYTTDVMLSTGYPLRDNQTSKITCIIDDNGTKPLTIQDAKIATSYGLDVDFDAVE
jgi:hypothetical protein